MSERITYAADVGVVESYNNKTSVFFNKKQNILKNYIYDTMAYSIPAISFSEELKL